LRTIASKLAGLQQAALFPACGKGVEAVEYLNVRFFLFIEFLTAAFGTKRQIAVARVAANAMTAARWLRTVGPPSLFFPRAPLKTVRQDKLAKDRR
jgi:hypothetical protein